MPNAHSLGGFAGVLLALVAMPSLGALFPAKAQTSLPFESLEEARFFNAKEAGVQVFRDEAAWLTLWRRSWAKYDGSGERTPAPDIDFGSKMVIGVFYGPGYSGCSNSVEVIESIIARSNRVEVDVVAMEPATLGICGRVVYPLQLVAVERLEALVVFVGEVPG